MNFTSAYLLIVSNITQFGVAVLAILTAIIVVAVGMLVFRYGFKKIAAVSGTGYRVGTSDEYPKAFRNSYIEAVGIYNNAHPDI